MVRRFLDASGKPEERSASLLVRCAAGSHESVASKEIEDLDKLKDEKILLSGLPFGLSALARAPSRRKVSLPLQPPGYLLRCHPVDEQH